MIHFLNILKNRNRKILRKLLAKSYKKKKFNQKILIDIKKFVIINWYYLLIIALITAFVKV